MSSLPARPALAIGARLLDTAEALAERREPEAMVDRTPLRRGADEPPAVAPLTEFLDVAEAVLEELRNLESTAPRARTERVEDEDA
jgi:hypothetical protein